MHWHLHLRLMSESRDYQSIIQHYETAMYLHYNIVQGTKRAKKKLKIKNKKII